MGLLLAGTGLGQNAWACKGRPLAVSAIASTALGASISILLAA